MKTFKLTLTDDNEWVFESTEDFCGNVTRSLTLGTDATRLHKASRILCKLIKREEDKTRSAGPAKAQP